MIAEVCPDSAAILENPAVQKTSMIIMKYLLKCQFNIL